MKPVKLGIAGLGNMGMSHLNDCSELGSVDLVAVCDGSREKAEQVASPLDGVGAFTDVAKMIEESALEAVIIASPHYSHTPASLAAFERGVHVLCEKPVGVHVKDVQLMIDAHAAARQGNPDLVFAAMLQQRTLEPWRTISKLLDHSRLGRLVRVTWIITTWFRTQIYFDSSSWRGTWKDEGGGVLLNQCPHNLDLYQWFFGMPSRVLGVASFGKYHNIEVEDEVTAVFEHENGMLGHFITSTAESPGTNRLEIVGEKGKLLCEDERLTLDLNETSMFRVLEESNEAFPSIPHDRQDVSFTPGGGMHREVIDRFARVIRGEGDLVADGAEGMGSVMLANSVIASHFAGHAVNLPLDGDEYLSLLERLISESTFERPRRRTDVTVDMEKSF